MTLMQIELLLHYRYSPEEHPYVTDEWCGCKTAIDALVADGMLKAKPEAEGLAASYELTERARVYVDTVSELPVPVQRWVMPEVK